MWRTQFTECRLVVVQPSLQSMALFDKISGGEEEISSVLSNCLF